MSATFTYYQPALLPWNVTDKAEKHFRRILTAVLLLSLAFGLVVRWLPLPPHDPNKVEELPPRYAKLLLEHQPLPPPKVERPLPPPPKTETPIQRPTPVERKPQTQAEQKARKSVEGAGLLALSKELSALADSSNVSTMVAKKLNTAPASTAAATVDTRILTSDTGRKSVGVRNDAHVGTVGTTRLDDSQQRVAQDLLAANTEKASGKAAGSGASAGTQSQGANPRRFEDVAMVMDQNKGTLYTIYNRTRRSNPGLKGKIVLVLTILPSGQVSNIVIKSSELNAPELEASLVARIRQFDFGKRPGGPLTVTVPVEFLPS